MNACAATTLEKARTLRRMATLESCAGRPVALESHHAVRGRWERLARALESQHAAELVREHECRTLREVAGA